jgi:hypothetical protein
MYVLLILRLLFACRLFRSVFQQRILKRRGHQKARERKAGVGHWDDDGVPEHFFKVLFQPTMGMLAILEAFMP